MQQSTDLLVAEIEGIETSSVDQLVHEMKIANALKRQELTLKRAELKMQALQIASLEASHPHDMWNRTVYQDYAKEILADIHL